MNDHPPDRVPVVDPLRIAAFAGSVDPDVNNDESRNLAIERLIFAYSYAWDARQPEATAALFTEDAVVDFYLAGASEPTHSTIGRARLLEEMETRTDYLKRYRVETRHLMTNTVARVVASDGVEVMTTAMIYWQQLPEHPTPRAVQTGYYKSWCVETESGWRFQRREAHLSGVFRPEQIFSGRQS
jgi:SnoaL-like domain